MTIGTMERPDWQATVTPCELIAWALESATRRGLMVAHLRRVGQTDLDFANGGGPTFGDKARSIARNRAADLFADAMRINGGRDPETFCGRLNACDWACGFSGLSSNNRADLFERGGIFPPA